MARNDQPHQPAFAIDVRDPEAREAFVKGRAPREWRRYETLLETTIDHAYWRVLKTMTDVRCVGVGCQEVLTEEEFTRGVVCGLCDEMGSDG